MKRFKTTYPGVFYREAERIGGPGSEKVFYILFKKDGKLFEEKVGRQFIDDMTPSKAAYIRGQRVEGKKQSRKEVRQDTELKKQAEKVRYTIGRLWDEYRMTREPGKSLKSDEGRYTLYLRPDFENKEPKDIIRLDVDRLRIRLSKEKSPQTVKHVLNLLTWIINFGVKNNLCQGLSFHVSKPTVDNLTTEDLSPDELKRLLAAIDADYDIQIQNIMRLALFTGMRRMEILKLKWDHIDFERGFIRIVDPKGGRDQTIPMNDAAKNVLLYHPRETEFVFPGRRGGHRADVNKGANRIKARAGLPKDFRPMHGLRHAYASMLASSGRVDMYVLQKLLTHKSPLMTQRYAHLRDDTLRRASNLAGDLITEAMNTEKKGVKENGKN